VFRVIARLDVKSENLIKGIRFEGLRKLGNPTEFAEKYYLEGIDEIFLVDNVASLYGRNHLGSLLEDVASKTFVPLSASGGVRNLSDAEELFSKGADKVGINTATFANSGLVREIANRFGSQAVIGSIHAKKLGDSWECLVEQGRERTGVSVVDRVSQLIDQGVGEILVTSVDQDGVEKGFDVELARVCGAVTTVPLVIGGGCGTPEHVEIISKISGISGVSVASALHYNRVTVGDLRKAASNSESLSGGHG
jgi:imidazoleglycerol phosphate synthase cyclase subunit